MKAEELMIGNYIGYYDKDTVLNVTYHEIRYSQINMENNYKPILLSEERLIKLGFKIIGNNYYLEHGAIEIGLMSSNRFYIQIRSEKHNAGN